MRPIAPAWLPTLLAIVTGLLPGWWIVGAAATFTGDLPLLTLSSAMMKAHLHVLVLLAALVVLQGAGPQGEGRLRGDASVRDHA